MRERLLGIGNRVRSSTPLLSAYLVAGILIAVACIWAMGRTESAGPTSSCPLRSRTEPPGIVALEFAGDVEAAGRIVDGWSACVKSPEDARERAQQALERDSTEFVPLSVLGLAWWCLYVYWGAYPQKVRDLALSLVVAVAVAGVLDLLENYALAKVIAGDASPWAALATIATVPKWVILALAVPVAIAALLGALWRLTTTLLQGTDADRSSSGR